MMFRTATRLILLLLVVVSAPRMGPQELQSWNEIDFAATWRKVDLLAPALARVDTQRPNPQFAGTGLLADFRVQANLTLTAGYLFVELPPYSTQVHSPLVAASASLRTGRLTLSDRNRFERLFGLGNVGRHAGLGASPVRYRNRLRAEEAFGARWHLFAEDEVFYDFEVTRWNQNRAQAGAGLRLNKRLLLDIYFLQQSLRRPNREIPVVGATLKVWLTPSRN